MIQFGDHLRGVQVRVSLHLDASFLGYPPSCGPIGGWTSHWGVSKEFFSDGSHLFPRFFLPLLSLQLFVPTWATHVERMDGPGVLSLVSPFLVYIAMHTAQCSSQSCAPGPLSPDSRWNRTKSLSVASQPCLIFFRW